MIKFAHKKCSARKASHAPAREQVHSLYGVRRMCLRDNMPVCEQAPNMQLSLIHAWLSKSQFVQFKSRNTLTI